MQLNYFSKYLSNAPVLAVLFTSAVLTLFILINKTAPDLLSFAL